AWSGELTRAATIASVVHMGAMILTTWETLMESSFCAGLKGSYCYGPEPPSPVQKRRGVAESVGRGLITVRNFLPSQAVNPGERAAETLAKRLATRYDSMILRSRERGAMG